MAAAKKCDRCGNFYMMRDSNRYIKTFDSRNDLKLYMDLCDACYEDLKAFLIEGVDIVKEVGTNESN